MIFRTRGFGIGFFQPLGMSALIRKESFFAAGTFSGFVRLGW
jgi:hypothetical protein